MTANYLKDLSSKYLLKKIFSLIEQKQAFEIVHYNKSLQEKLDLGLNDYKTYKNIEIELIPKYTSFNKFINILSKEDYSLIHIYFDDDFTHEIKRTYLTKEEKNIKKIKIILEKEFNSFKGLFENCECIEKIIFIKFNRKDITDMSHMFSGCTSLEEIYFNKFNSINVTNMSSMFSYCYNLHNIEFNNFVTDNVINMNYMFYKCLSLKKIENPNFNINKVENKNDMLNDCPLSLRNFLDVNKIKF